MVKESEITKISKDFYKTIKKVQSSLYEEYGIKMYLIDILEHFHRKKPEELVNEIKNEKLKRKEELKKSSL